jgi:hypothetical protein
MKNKALIMQQACELILTESKEDAIYFVNEEYKFDNIDVKVRKYTEKQKIKIFFRDGFIDRYNGNQLLNPGVLKVFSVYYPKEFPYHKNWKMDETHRAYWELLPTIDHIKPISIGGEDSEYNLVTTSMINNSIKSNWTLKELGWELISPGSIKEWDGLTSIFISIIEKDKELLKDNYIAKWYRLSKSMNSVSLR